MRFKLFAALVLLATNAFATTFGDTSYVASGTLMQGCGTYMLTSLPVAVSVNSRINVSARATVVNGTALTAQVYVILKDATTSTQVATNEAATINVTNSNQLQFVSSDGLLHQGLSHSDDASPRFVAAPGSYTLQMLVDIAAPAGSDCGTPTLINQTLTYILLSSSFDTIFINGFQAMLDGDGNSAASVA